MTQNYSIHPHDKPPLMWRIRSAFDGRGNTAYTRNLIVTLLMGIALIAFEIFNFDTTRFALNNLIGDVRFAGIGWSSILAVAFCSIDGAGLFHLFGERKDRGLNSTWYLMGAWLLGATMNAVMTWWAVSVTLLSHEFGNEILSRETLLGIVPLFVAVLVWLTRVLFIGALSMSGAKLVDANRQREIVPVSAYQAHSVVPNQTVIRKRKANEPLMYRQPEQVKTVNQHPQATVRKRTTAARSHNPQKQTVQKHPQPKQSTTPNPTQSWPPNSQPTRSSQPQARPSRPVPKEPGVQAKPFQRN